MKIVIFELEPWERKSFDKITSEHDVMFLNESLSIDTVDHYSNAEVVSTFIYSELHEDILTRFSQLQLIATRSTGFDHIDLGYCKNHDVTVCNVPTYGENTVAEHVFGLLLTISHNLSDAIERTRKGDFSLQGLRGFDLRNKTLGVIGTGTIGQCVIEIGSGFAMNIIAYDAKPVQETASRLGFRYVDFEELLSSADIITLHVPANKATHHMLSTEQFKMMKDGVVLINTARGSVVDIQALLQALSNGKVAAAGLDVLPEEPAIREEAELLRSFFQKKHNLEMLLADHILLRMRNVIITPHSAFNTREAIQRILDTTVDNIVSFAKGKPSNVVSG